MRTIRDGLIIVLGLFGLVSISLWERVLRRNIGYYDWPSRPLTEYERAVKTIDRNVRQERVKELYGRAKAEHRPTA